MTDLSDLLTAGVPVIAVSFSDHSSDAELATAKARGLDVAELRIDRFESSDPQYVLKHVQRFAALPTIATIRASAEGGDWHGPESERLDLFRTVLGSVDGIDVELSSTTILPELVAEARAAKRVVIISHHDFRTTPGPQKLKDLTAEAKERGADYVKIAAMAQSPDDVRTLATFTLEHTDVGVITVAMGAHGVVSRILFPALGSRLTYAHGGQEVVSGQLEFTETLQMLRLFYPEFDEKKTEDRPEPH